MNVRRLTPHGIESFTAYISQLRADGTIPPPVWLLSDETSSEGYATSANIDQREFASRLDLAEYLDNVLSGSDITNVSRDVGLWSWFTLFYFDQVCPPKKGGVRKPRETSGYIPAVKDYQKYYRHLLLGPYLIYQAHRSHLSDAMSILRSPVSIINDVVGQIAARGGWVSNRAVVGVATRLYIDADSGDYKHGSGGKGNGSPRRLSDVLDQFDLTYDLFGISADALLQLLPSEFDRFRI